MKRVSFSGVFLLFFQVQTMDLSEIASSPTQRLSLRCSDGQYEPIDASQWKDSLVINVFLEKVNSHDGSLPLFLAKTHYKFKIVRQAKQSLN